MCRNVSFKLLTSVEAILQGKLYSSGIHITGYYSKASICIKTIYLRIYFRLLIRRINNYIMDTPL